MKEEAFKIFTSTWTVREITVSEEMSVCVIGLMPSGK